MRIEKLLRNRKESSRPHRQARSPLKLETLEPRVLLSAKLVIDHFNIVKDTIEAGSKYEVEYEFHNIGDDPTLAIAYMGLTIYKEDHPGTCRSMGSFYFPQVQPGESSGRQSAWVYSTRNPPMDLPYGPGEFVVKGFIGRTYATNEPVFDSVIITENDHSPPEAELISAPNINNDQWGDKFFEVSVRYTDDIVVWGGGSRDIKITGPNGFETLSGTTNLIQRSDDYSIQETSYKHYTPGHSWEPEDNGTYTITLQADKVKDSYQRIAPEKFLGTFDVNLVPQPPTAELVDPPDNGHVSIEDLSGYNNRYIYVRYSTPNPTENMSSSTIFDDEPEFSLTYANGQELPHDGEGRYMYQDEYEPVTYRYKLIPDAQHPLQAGKVTVGFLAGSFEDSANIPNEAFTQTFYIDPPATAPLADLVYPPPNQDVDTSELNQNQYVDVKFSRTDIKTIDGDEIAFSGAGGDSVNIKGKPAKITEDIYRYTLEGSFAAGPVEIEFVGGAFENTDGEANTAETEGFSSLPDIAPLQFSIATSQFVWDNVKGRYIYSGTFGMGLKPPDGETFSPLITVEGTAGFDATKVFVNGVVSANIGGSEVPLTQGEYEYDVGAAFTSVLNEAAGQLPNEFTVAGTELKLTKMEFVIPDGKHIGYTQLELQGSVKMPDDMGGFELAIADPHKLVISPVEGVSLSGGSLKLPDLEIFMFGGELKMIAKDMSVEYIAKVENPTPPAAPTPAALRFRGEVSLPYFYNATANFTPDDQGNDSYIEVTELGGVDWYGTLSVEDIVIVPGAWELEKVSLGMKKDVQENYITEAEAKLAIPTGIEIGAKLGFVNGDFNFVELEVDKLNKPIGTTGAFLQKIMGRVNHVSEFDTNPLSFGGGIGLTAGPQVSVNLPDWLNMGDKIEGSLVGLDLEADLDENHLTGHGFLDIVNGLAYGNANAELNWQDGFLAAQADFNALDGLLVANGSFRADTDMNISMAGTGTVTIPKVVPLWGGTELGSANVKLQYVSDQKADNDFFAGWGRILVSEYSTYYLTGGIRVNFDGSYSFMGAQDIAQLTSGNNSPSGSMAKTIGTLAEGDAIASKTYTVTADTPWILLGAEWDNDVSDVAIQLTAPDGTVFSETDIDNDDSMFIVQELSGLQRRVVYVHVPSHGDWTLTIPQDDALTGIDFAGYAHCEGPQVEITGVSFDNSDEITIQYDASSGASDAQVSFYYDVDGEGADGVLLAGGIEAAGLDAVAWDASASAPGSYYIYAVVGDEKTPPVVYYWDQPVDIEHGTVVQVGDGLAKAVVLTDADGSVVTVKLAKGQGNIKIAGEKVRTTMGKKGCLVEGENLSLSGIELTQSTEKTSLMILTKGGATEGASLGGVTGDTLGKLVGKQLDLVGDIELTGSLGAVMLDDIAEDVMIMTGQGGARGFSLRADDIGEGVRFDLAGTVKKFQAGSFATGILQADEIGQVKIMRDAFGADVQARLGDILGVSSFGDITGRLSAKGVINKAASKAGKLTGVVRAGKEIFSLTATELNGAIVSSGGNINKVSTKGDILDSFIMGGYDIGPDCAFGLRQTGGGDVLRTGNIGSVTARGVFRNSYVAAGALPSSSLTNYLPDVGNESHYGNIGKVQSGTGSVRNLSILSWDL